MLTLDQLVHLTWFYAGFILVRGNDCKPMTHLGPFGIVS